MNSKMIVAIVFALPMGAMSASCAAGMKAKATLTDLYCSTSATAAGTCGDCCEADTTTCGGASPSVTCPAGKYANAAGTTGTTEAACCTDGAACDTNACGAGYTLKSTTELQSGTGKCSAATCTTSDQSECCKADTTKCGGAFTCPTGTYAKAAGTTGTTEAECCTDKSACASAACGAGYKLKTNAANYNCSMATCTTSDQSTCCDMDATKCGGNTTFSCDAGTFKDTAKAGNDASDPTAAQANCCTANPTPAACAAAACGTNYKLKDPIGSLKCAGATCVSSDQSTCCDLDTTICGGAGTVNCDANMYKDSTKAAMAVGSDAKAACCTAQATCQAFIDSGKTGLTSGGPKPQPIHIGFILAAAFGAALMK